jgi:hypothetical protein
LPALTASASYSRLRRVSVTTQPSFRNCCMNRSCAASSMTFRCPALSWRPAPASLMGILYLPPPRVGQKRCCRQGPVRTSRGCARSVTATNCPVCATPLHGRTDERYCTSECCLRRTQNPTPNHRNPRLLRRAVPGASTPSMNAVPATNDSSASNGPQTSSDPPDASDPARPAPPAC